MKKRERHLKMLEAMRFIADNVSFVGNQVLARLNEEKFAPIIRQINQTLSDLGHKDSSHQAIVRSFLNESESRFLKPIVDCLNRINHSLVSIDTFLKNELCKPPRAAKKRRRV